MAINSCSTSAVPNTWWSIPQGSTDWGPKLNERLEALASRLEHVEKRMEALLLAIQKDLPAIQEHAPDVLAAAAEIAMDYARDK